MNASSVTIAWLQSLNFHIQPASKGPTISGVIVKELKVNLDGRGEVTELWSAPWADEGILPVQHAYQSATDCGVVKAWHLHSVHTDQFTVTRGKIQVVLIDLRQESPTFGHVNSVFMGTLKPRLLQIPPGVLHGWKSLSAPEVLVVNMQTHVYNPEDEFKFPWDCILTEIWEPKNG